MIASFDEVAAAFGEGQQIGEGGIAVVGIYTDPAHVIAYADGEVRQEFNITYLGRVTGGTITGSHESTEVRFVDPAEFDHIPIHGTVRLRHHAEDRQTPT